MTKKEIIQTLTNNLQFCEARLDSTYTLLKNEMLPYLRVFSVLPSEEGRFFAPEEVAAVGLMASTLLAHIRVSETRIVLDRLKSHKGEEVPNMSEDESVGWALGRLMFINGELDDELDDELDMLDEGGLGDDGKEGDFSGR